MGNAYSLWVVIFILALGAILAFTRSAVRTHELDMVVMDVAGRQRMMIQRHLNKLLLAIPMGFGRIFNPWKQSIVALRRCLTEWGRGGREPVHRRTAFDSPQPRPPGYGNFWMSNVPLLEEFFAKIRTLLLEDPDHFTSSESFSSLNQLHYELQRNADAVFKLFSASSRQNVVDLMKSEPFIGFLVIFLSIVLARQVVSTSRRLEREIAQRKKAEEERALRDRSINSATNGIPHCRRPSTRHAHGLL